MKQRILSLTIVAISIFITITSCHKEGNMQVTVTVKLMSDTNITIPNTLVEFHQDEAIFSGYTNEKGQISNVFNSRMVLDITAVKDSLSGNGVLNLIDYNKHYRKSIYIY